MNIPPPQALIRMIHHVIYIGEIKPDPSISDERWGAMLKVIKRELKEIKNNRKSFQNSR